MRRTFLKATVRRGAAWLWGITDHLGRGVTVLAFLGLPTGLALFSDLGVVWPLVAAAALVLVALFEGAFETWHEDHDELVARQGYENTTAGFREVCERWVRDVERLLDVRTATRPVEPGSMMDSLVWDALEQRKATAEHDAETVATYIEKYRDKGVSLFDALVDLRHIVPNNRDIVRRPRTVSQVRDAADTVETAASRIGSEGF